MREWAREKEQRAEVCEGMGWLLLIAIWRLTGGERDPAGVTSRSVYRVISVCQLRWTEGDTEMYFSL